jgi:hypothetical protein
VALTANGKVAARCQLISTLAGRPRFGGRRVHHVQLIMFYQLGTLSFLQFPIFLLDETTGHFTLPNPLAVFSSLSVGLLELMTHMHCLDNCLKLRRVC